MFAHFIIRIILVTLWPLVLRDCGAAFITNPVKMTPSRCVGSISFLDDSQQPRVTFNKSVRRVRRLEAREVRVEGCGCFDLYKLRHYRGSSQQVGPGVSEVNLRWVRSVERSECEAHSSTPRIRKTYRVRKIETLTQQSTTTSVETTTATVTTVTTPKTTKESTLLTTVPGPTSEVLTTTTTLTTTAAATAPSTQTENPSTISGGRGWAATKVKESIQLDKLSAVGETTTTTTVTLKVKPILVSEKDINKQHVNQTSITRSWNKTLIILEEHLTATWTESYQTSPISINTVSQTSEPGSMTQIIKTSNKTLSRLKIKSPSSGFQRLDYIGKKSSYGTFIKSEKAPMEESTPKRELNQQVDITADSVMAYPVPEVSQDNEEKEERVKDELDLEIDATMTNNKIETDNNAVDATDPITEHENVNEIQKESMEPKMSSLVSFMSSSALKRREPIVFILIVQIVLK